MPELTQDDITLGRLALQNGALTRPQLDQAVALVRGGQATDLARALLRTGGVSVPQLEQLRAQVVGGSRGGGGDLSGSMRGQASPLAASYRPPADLAGSARGQNGGAPWASQRGPSPVAMAPGPAPGSEALTQHDLADGEVTMGLQMPAFNPAAPTAAAYATQPPAYGAASASAFGPPPMFGAPAGFGSAAPVFGAPAGPAFGTAPGAAYGSSPAAAGFGSGPVAPDFGAGPGGAQTGVQDKVGDWVIEREIARGGMGAIYLGKSEKTGEKAAIKVMLTTDGTVNPKKVKRFLREIDANKKLVHPGIVRILDIGEFNGYPFFAMEFIEGKPLDRMLKDDLDLEIGMEILEGIARAVHYAHEQGIVHRDLKPANVIVMEDMQPKLTDFGLAKDSDNQSVLTKTGAVLGTPYYLSPEQASGKSKDLDARADIYSLGVIMYELATGRLPFVGQTTVELYNRIIHDEPVPPSKVKPQLTKELENVVLKAMAKDPDDRYETAAQLADDIQALLQGAKVSAKQDNKAQRLAKKVKRAGAVPLLLGGMGLALIVVVGGIVVFYKRAEAETRRKNLADELSRFDKANDGKLGDARAAVTAGSAALAQAKVPDALARAGEALDALTAIEGSLEQVKLEENKPVAQGQLDAGKGQRAAVRAEALVLRARSTMQRDEQDALKSAQDDLTAARELAPDLVDAAVAQADLLALQGKPADALTQYGQALEKDPKSLRAQVGRVRALLLLESFGDAIATAGGALSAVDAAGDAVAAVEKKDVREALLIARARANLETGDLDKARADAHAAVALAAPGWRAKAMLGTVLLRAGDRFAGRDAFADALEAAKPHKAGPLVARAEALLEAGRAAEALEDAREAVADDPASLLALVVRAEAEEALLRFADAHRNAESVTFRAQPRDWRLLARAERVLARVYASNQNMKDAHDHAKKANQLDEASTDGKLLLGTVELDPQFEDLYLDNAENLFKGALRARPRSLEAKRGWGLVLLAKHGRSPERAEAKLAEALDEDPRDPWTLTALAKIVEDKGQADKARALRLRAARAERDVRRREGWYLAVGLRELKRGLELAGQQQAEHVELARDAYRRATFVDPKHAQALTGLAAISHHQSARQRTDQQLKKALEASPSASQGLVLQARHAASRDMRDKDHQKAIDAVQNALQARGQTIELLNLRALLTFKEPLAQGEDPGAKIRLAFQRFDEVRVRDPWSLTSFELEKEQLGVLLGRGTAAVQDPALKAEVEERETKVRAAHSKLQRDMDQCDERAKEAWKRAESLIESSQPDAALKAATEASRIAPWRAEAWHALARARSSKGDAWGALAAGIRAANTKDTYATQLFGLLRHASSLAGGDLEKAIQITTTADKDVFPFEADLQLLLRSAPQVAKALVAKPDREVGLKTAEALEQLVNHDPTLLAPQVLLGVLAYGADQDELAIQHLLLVATIREDAGEAYYLAAIVAASGSKATQNDLVTAVEWLQQASAANYDWAARGLEEQRLAKLRASPLWQLLPEAQEGSR